jgi:hypothetical protein
MNIQVFNGRNQQLFSTLSVVTAANPILLEGEVWIEKDAATGRSTGRRKVGDGVVSGGTIAGTAFNDLPFEPGGTAGASYVHLQSSPATTWTMAHNLGFKPSVELLNSGSQEIEGDVVHPTQNVAVAYFNIPIAGFARLN